MKKEGKITIFGEHEEGTLNQIKKSCSPDTVRAGVLCADGHKGYAVPIGGVVAYHNAISPSAVGFDIACGNLAVRLDIPGSELRKNIKTIMDDIFSTISFGIGRKNKEEVISPVFEGTHDGLWNLPGVPPKDFARGQLGTVGGGNHYVDLFEDEQGMGWIGVHFGSRGFGHKIATYYLKAGGGTDGMDVEPLVLSLDTAIGQDYLGAMQLAGMYAYAGRHWVCSKIAKMLGADVLEEVHNHHNFTWAEKHGDEVLFVCRKGATPAFPGQKGFVGGSMGDISVILEGVDSEESKAALYSTVHGAGRVMSRTQAKGKYNRKTGALISPGCVTPEMMNEWILRKKVELRGGGLDESPHCYKRIEEVLAHHSATIKILHTLQPIGVAMASANEIDPWKD